MNMKHVLGGSGGALLAVGALGLSAVVLSADRASGTEGRVAPTADLAVLRAGASDFQREILADGLVTRAEYESAVRATVACLAASAVPDLEIGEPVWVGQQLVFSFSAPGDAVDGHDVAGVAYTRCHEQNEKQVATVWAGIAPAMSAEEAQATTKRLATCLRAHGVALPGAPDFQQVAKAVEGLPDRSVLPACLAEIN